MLKGGAPSRVFFFDYPFKLWDGLLAGAFTFVNQSVPSGGGISLNILLL